MEDITLNLYSDNRIRTFLGNLQLLENGCIIWTGPKFHDGYGKIGVDRSTMLVHRYCWLLYKGSLPPFPLCLCHTCDNRPCCNLEHLFVGTNKDNTKDAQRKGRFHEIPEETRQIILELRRQGFTHEGIAIKVRASRSFIKKFLLQQKLYRIGGENGP